VSLVLVDVVVVVGEVELVLVVDDSVEEDPSGSVDVVVSALVSVDEDEETGDVVVGLAVGLVFRGGAGDVVTASDGSPGPIRRLASDGFTLRPICGPRGAVVDVDEGDGLVSETSLSGPPIDVPTDAALSARGAATTTAVAVESDRANRNRRRPLGSSGRCKYIQVDLS